MVGAAGRARNAGTLSPSPDGRPWATGRSGPEEVWRAPVGLPVADGPPARPGRLARAARGVAAPGLCHDAPLGRAPLRRRRRAERPAPRLDDGCAGRRIPRGRRRGRTLRRGPLRRPRPAAGHRRTRAGGRRGRPGGPSRRVRPCWCRSHGHEPPHEPGQLPGSRSPRPAGRRPVAGGRPPAVRSDAVRRRGHGPGPVRRFGRLADRPPGERPDRAARGDRHLAAGPGRSLLAGRCPRPHRCRGERCIDHPRSLRRGAGRPGRSARDAQAGPALGGRPRRRRAQA